jgi:hypothetical protein
MAVRHPAPMDPDTEERTIHTGSGRYAMAKGGIGRGGT